MKRFRRLAWLSCLATFQVTAAFADQPPLRVGVLTDMSGIFSDEAGEGAAIATRLAAEDFGGSVLGRRIEVIVADHQNKPETAIDIARQWYDTEHVGMITNLINSAIALAVVDLARQKDRIAIVTGAGSSRLTNDSCTQNSIHYAYDTYSLARGTARTLLKQGGNTWFFLTADYAFGQSLQADTEAVLANSGGTSVASVKYPLNSTDLSSFLLQAQASRAKVVAFAGSGTTFINAVKSAREFGMTDNGGQTLAGLLVWLTDVKALGLETAEGLLLTNAFYWDRDDETRAFAKKFWTKAGRPPQMGDAADYSATMHYLQAVRDAGTDDAQSVMAKMRATPVNDFFAHGGVIRPNGQMAHDMYVYQVKTKAESNGPWDFYKPVATVPADEAFRPLAESTCPLLKR